MASLPKVPKGRDFTAEELIGRTIRIEGPIPRKSDIPTGQTIVVTADGELVANACKAVLTLEADDLTMAKITLWCDGQQEEVTLRDNIEVSFSAVVIDVDNEESIDTTKPEFAQQFKGFINKTTHAAIEANTEVQ